MRGFARPGSCRCGSPTTKTGRGSDPQPAVAGNDFGGVSGDCAIDEAGMAIGIVSLAPCGLGGSLIRIGLLEMSGGLRIETASVEPQSKTVMEQGSLALGDDLAASSDSIVRTSASGNLPLRFEASRQKASGRPGRISRARAERHDESRSPCSACSLASAHHKTARNGSMRRLVEEGFGFVEPDLFEASHAQSVMKLSDVRVAFDGPLIVLGRLLVVAAGQFQAAEVGVEPRSFGSRPLARA